MNTMITNGDRLNVVRTDIHCRHGQITDSLAMAVPPPKPPEVLQRIRIKNRRKRYLDTHPDYFSPSLELAGLTHRSRAKLDVG